MDKSRCVGCKNDFYNGNNPYGVKECWSLSTAVLILRKAVHINQTPPWNQQAQEYPSCYEMPHHVFVKPEVSR